MAKYRLSYKPRFPAGPGGVVVCASTEVEADGVHVGTDGTLVFFNNVGNARYIKQAMAAGVWEEVELVEKGKEVKS